MENKAEYYRESGQQVRKQHICIPKVEHICRVILIDKHVVPVTDGEAVEDSAQSLNTP